MKITPGFLGRMTFMIVLLFVTACGSTSTLRHPTTSATLWVQNASEYRALTTSIYRTALSNLGLAIADSYWTAYADRSNDNYRGKPPAVILDVDETVLDNSAFQARMIKQKSTFDPRQWNSWVMEAKADPVPGALEFTQRAAKEGVTVFYITNREAKVEEGTRQNLRKLGFPLPENEDHILSKNEHASWTYAKTERRAFVAKDHRILMIFGDDLNDFTPAKGITQEQRHRLVEKHMEKWGRQWYLLPNPVYGSWESALYNFDNSLKSSEIDSIKRARLNSKN